MPIDQSKLDALKSLASGGSAGLDAYRQAQGAEQASRTEALKGALGGQGVYEAAQKAQAQYAPSVGTTGFENADNLAPAANQFLHEGASKLANQAYEAQQNLTLQAEGLRRAEQGKYNDEMLKGAAAAFGEKQKAALNAVPLGELTNQRAEITRQLQEVQMDAGTQAPTPELEQRKADLQNQLAATDVAFQEKAKALTGAIGTDTKGFEEAYNANDIGKVQGLIDYLAPKTEARGRQIDLEGNKRLQQLAPAFGINELAAKGMFPEEGGIANGIKQAQLGEAADQYISGKPSAKESAAARKQQDEQDAAALGFDNPADYNRLRTRTGLSGQDIQGAMQSKPWQDINEIVDGATTAGASFEDIQKAVREHVNALTNDKGEQLPQKERARLIELADTYFKPAVKAPEAD